jgi:hypothetical protein
LSRTLAVPRLALAKLGKKRETTVNELSEDDRRAPYVTYRNLTDFIDETLSRVNLPEHIDPHFLRTLGMSPHTQLLLLQALRVIGLIDDDRRPTEALRHATKYPESRRAMLQAWGTGFYADQIELAKQQASALELQDSFGRFGYRGSTLRKAMGFFLGLSQDVELPTSRYFATPRQFPQPSTRRPERLGRFHSAGPMIRRVEEGERRVIAFAEAGQIVLDVQLRWLDLPLETIQRLRGIIGELEDLGRGGAAQPAEPVS